MIMQYCRAVVDANTLWKNTLIQNDLFWKCSACKIYAKMDINEWKIIEHTGLLNYNN